MGSTPKKVRTPREEKCAQRDAKTRRLEDEWIGSLRRETLRQEEAERIRREWN
jgi:hypothetical protein